MDKDAEEMTPEERERFERERIHHEAEEQPSAGPASESQTQPHQPTPPVTNVQR